MKTFETWLPSPTQQALAHVVSTNPTKVILDAGYLPLEPLNEHLNASCLCVGAAVAKALEKANIPFETQFLVEYGGLRKNLITRQRELAAIQGLLLGDPSMETEVYPAAAQVIQTLKMVADVGVEDGETFLYRNHLALGRLPSGKTKLVNQNKKPTGAVIDAALVQKHHKPGIGFVSVLPATLADQQKNLARILKALDINANYTALLCDV